jgi:hypothetical protein
MHHGLHTAVNIHQKILSEQRGMTTQFKELDSNVPPMMGIAVGKKAASCSPSAGINASEEVLRLFFGNDLGFTSTFLSHPSLNPHHTKEKRLIYFFAHSLLELSSSRRGPIQARVNKPVYY